MYLYIIAYHVSRTKQFLIQHTVNNYMFPVYFYNRNLNGNLPITIHFIFPYENYDVYKMFL